MSKAKDEAEKILESLSQEERLKLLERLIQGAAEAHEESLTVEERLERLEKRVLGGHGGGHKRVFVRRFHGGPRWEKWAGDMAGGCACCS